MNWFNIILVGAGLTTPIGGLVVSRMGLVAGEKLFLLASCNTPEEYARILSLRPNI